MTVRPVVVHVSPRGNAFMRDIAAWLAEAAGLTGRRAELRTDGALPDGSATTHLVVAPHEFYPLGEWSDRDVWRAASISTPVCTEQPGTSWFEITRLYAEHSPTVFDINASGADALADAGLDAHHLRLGGVPGMDRRRDRRFDERNVELLFLGGKTERRAAILAELAPLLWDRAADLRLFSFNSPVTDGVGGLVFGPDKYDLLADSRILLNLHRDGPHEAADRVAARHGYFEWARMVEAMANGCCIVSEPSVEHEPLRAGDHFVEADDVVAAVSRLLDEPERCATIGARAAEAVLEEYPLVDSLRPLLDELDTRPVPSPARRWFAPRYNSKALRAEQRPLLPVFRPTIALRRQIYDALTAETLHQRSIDRARCLHRHGSDDVVIRTASESYGTSVPEVSVVVTLFGYGHLVAETLDSIAASTGVELEIVVVDDHSLDGGRQVVADWIDAHPEVSALLLGSEVNRGLPAARNLGIAEARADQVMVMDADNLLYPTALRRLANALEDDPTASFAYSALEEFGTRRGVRSAMAWHVPWLCEGNYIDAQAMLRRADFERLGGYRTDDPMIFGWEDWDLWLRIADEGGHGVHVGQMLGRYRTQPESMLSTTSIVADEMLDHVRERFAALPWAPWL